MPLLVRPCHHHRFRAVLDDAFRLRREVFGADRAAEAGPGREDAEPGDPASYLVSLDAAGRVIATVHARPATAGDSACDRLAGWTDAAIPLGPHVAQVSRLCIVPDAPREERLRILRDLRGGLAQLFARHGWTGGIVVGHDRHVQPFICSGMTVRVLAPPMLLAGDSQLTFAVLASDREPPGRATDPARLQDPDEDPSLFTLYGDRAVA